MKCVAVLLMLSFAVVYSILLDDEKEIAATTPESKEIEEVGAEIRVSSEDQPSSRRATKSEEELFVKVPEGLPSVDLPSMEGLDIDEEIRARRLKFMTACCKTGKKTE